MFLLITPVQKPYRYNTINDILVSQPLTVEGEIEEEHFGCFAVKGIEFEATVLYAGVSDFARLSLELSAAEMLTPKAITKNK